ncbi:hypothetical protein CRI94_01020 [Longibacter salinarum]|uniref:Uncharacterized protein n=1 Tax=Longibacter salinarum TaxID=1850348 RepID=A0A2A8D271_9BACT|nr:hypothetical protein CRI94_01020 [Longibacter salinarum]
MGPLSQDRGSEETVDLELTSVHAGKRHADVALININVRSAVIERCAGASRMCRSITVVMLIDSPLGTLSAERNR